MEMDNEATIMVRQDRGARPVVEVELPAGTSLEVSRRVEDLVYQEIAPKWLNLGACPGCRSGLDLYMKERFDPVIRVDLGSFQIRG